MVRPTQPFLCKRCGYDLSGSRSPYFATCPECGLTGPLAYIVYDQRPWPSLTFIAAALSGPTVLLCCLCAVATAVQPLCIANIILVPAAFFSGPLVPVVTGITLAQRHSTRRDRSRHAFGLAFAGWVANFVIGLGFLALATVLIDSGGLFED